MTGIERIAEERRQQVEKHGFDAAHDEQYGNGELLGAALFCLTREDCFWPKGWSDRYRENIVAKTDVERCAVAGALVAAHIDRLECHLPVDADDMVEMLYKLRDGEGSAVTLYGDNPDFNDLPNCAVSVNAGWTGHEDRWFRADTVGECLRDALAAKRAAGSGGLSKAEALVALLVSRMDGLGFGADEDSQVSGGDCVDLLCEFEESLRAVAGRER